ncbi:hypothetical protein WJX72_008687 [[Myrmecia] bisecta]|uniref:Uncharacterized protein n=1 Tax=[Myrmecia] bisecta TaxID=41462 RepID=A0AAW1Q0U6_9CHLO
MVSSGAVPFGTWLSEAICLVPQQICRVEGGKLVPLSDGSRSAVDPAVTSIDQLAKSISFGMYDSVLQAASGIPVVVGMNSWERTENEDMLLALFSAALSYVTMLKIHFTFDRYVASTLERFNLGASKVKSMCGSSQQTKVYKGSLMFALKDTQASAVREIRTDFRNHLQRVVQQPDNFLSTMYSGRYTLADFPSHQTPSFYRKLEAVAAALGRVDTQFHSGNDVASMAHDDAGSLGLVTVKTVRQWRWFDEDEESSGVAGDAPGADVDAPDAPSLPCKQPYGSPHVQHWCLTGECIKRCALCDDMCASHDHFHDDTPGAVHLCSRQHACVDPNLAGHPAKLCESPGTCEIRPHPTVETRTFAGHFDEFEYTYKVQQVEAMMP